MNAEDLNPAMADVDRHVVMLRFDSLCLCVPTGLVCLYHELCAMEIGSGFTPAIWVHLVSSSPTIPHRFWPFGLLNPQVGKKTYETIKTYH